MMFRRIWGQLTAEQMAIFRSALQSAIQKNPLCKQSENTEQKG